MADAEANTLPWTNPRTMWTTSTWRCMLDCMAGGALHRLSLCLSTALPALPPDTSKPLHISTCLQFGGQASHDDWDALRSLLTMPESEIADLVLDSSFEGAECKVKCRCNYIKSPTLHAPSSCVPMCLVLACPCRCSGLALRGVF